MANEGNLIPAKKGEIRNPKGKPKGTKSWATVIKNLLEDEQLLDKVVKKKPDWFASLPKKNGSSAIVVAMMAKAMQGDTKAATWLSKTGYGDKHVHEFATDPAEAVLEKMGLLDNAATNPGEQPEEEKQPSEQDSQEAIIDRELENLEGKETQDAGETGGTSEATSKDVS